MADGRRLASCATGCRCILLALLLAGCTVGPDYERPSLWTPGSWLAGRPPPDQASPPVAEPVDPRWWALLGDPVLTGLMERVAAENLDVRLATARLAQSRAQRRIIGAAEVPRVDGGASYQRERVSDRGVLDLLNRSSPGVTVPSGGIGAFDLFQYGFDASWELDLFGRVRRAIEASDQQVAASAEARRGLLVSVMAELARDYIQLRAAQRYAQVSRESLDSARRSAKLAAERRRGGRASDLDVANAQGQVASIAATLPRLQQQELQLANILALLLGAPPGALTPALTGSNAAPLPTLPRRVPVGLPSELARRRPDIREAEARLHAATAEIGQAEADFYPRITLSGSFSLQALQFRNLGDWAARTYGLGPGISIPIFQGGRLRGQLELRQQQQREAAIGFQKTVLAAFHDVDNALIAYRAEQRRTVELRRAVEQNRRALALAQLRYRQGLSVFLEVLTAQRGALAADQQLVESQATAGGNLVQLYKALGGGWEPAYPEDEARVAAAQRR